jgi:hypothetical protein
MALKVINSPEQEEEDNQTHFHLLLHYHCSDLHIFFTACEDDI